MKATTPALVLLASLAPAAGAQTALHTFTAPVPNTGFGHSVRSAGDVNGDGHDDVIIGSPSEGGATGPPVGRARVFSGKDASVLHFFVGESQSFQFGFAVDGAGDVNADGVPDLLVGDYNDDNVTLAGGLARIYSGKDGSILKSHYGAALDAVGYSLAAAGDVDLDGFADVLVGAPQIFVGTNEQGYARVFAGNGGGTLHTFFGAGPQCRFGTAVDGLGDANGDGVPDFLVGAYWSNAAYAEAYAGGTGALLWHRGNLWDGFGRAASAAGDANADGVPDAAVGGAPSLVTSPGHAAALSGVDGATLHQWDVGATLDLFGYSVGRAGDANGDGFADVIVGAAGAGPPGTVHVFSGATGIRLYRVSSPPAASLFGASVDTAGDFNADSYPDFIVGAWTGAGSAIVYSATCKGLQPYGAGTAGCAGPARMNASGVPFVGAAGFALTCDAAPPGALGLGLVGNVADVTGSDPFALGVLFHVDLFASAQLIALNVLSGPTGFGAAPAPIPNDPSLQGLSVVAQTVWAWPAAACSLPPFGLASTNGLAITFQ